jgi:hypothetical protein
MTTTTNRANNDVGNFAPVLGWLDHAIAQGARSPRIKIRTSVNGVNHLVGLALPKYPRPGDRVLYVKMDGAYVGSVRITTTGSVFFARGWYTPGTINALRFIGDNALAAAVASGHATGNCSFCARDLTDPRSTSVGYGPICAARFGLPWGETGAAAARIAAPRRTRPAAATPSLPITAPVAPQINVDVAERTAMEAARVLEEAIRVEQDAMELLRQAQQRVAAAQVVRDAAEQRRNTANANWHAAREAVEVPASQYPNGYTPLPNTDIGNIFANAVALNMSAPHRSGEE